MTPLGEHVAKGIAGRTAELIDLLVSSVRATSVSGYEDEVCRLYQRFADQRGWPVEAQPLAETADLADGEPRAAQRHNLHLWAGGRRHDRYVVINGHMDVVPADDTDGWSAPPFAGTRSNGVTIGRGTVDTKGGIAAALVAASAIEDAGADLGFDVLLQLVVGEETTGVGTRAALRRYGSPLAAIVLEATDGALTPANSGIQFFTIKVSGRAAHTSLPWLGEDAFARLARIYAAVQRLDAQRAQRCHHPLFDEYPTAVPLAVGLVRAGTFRASVPDSAEMSGRIGVLPGETIDQVRAELAAAVRSAGEDDPWLAEHPAAIVWESNRSSWQTPVDAPLVLAFAQAQQRVRKAARLTGCTAGCDASYYAERGVATLIYGPGAIALAHGPDERVADRDLVEAAQVLAGGLLGLPAEMAGTP